MKVFSLSTCDTCRKAVREMTEAGLTVEVTDIRKDGMSAEEIGQIVSAFGDKAVNKASATWRNLSDEDKARDPAELIADNPTVMKRPVIVKDGLWFQGWTAKTKAEVLG